MLLISVDTLRADHLGCYGAERAHTTHMDTVAARGVRFLHAISPAPLTLPAHATLLTGLDPPRHGVRHNGVHRLPDGVTTLAQRLRQAGFATAAFVGALVLDARFGLDRGFEVYDDAMGERRSGLVGYAERRADRVTEAALGWIETAPSRFLLWVHYYDPHTAYAPPRGFASAFASRPYAGEIAFVDTQIGRLLAGLHERFEAEGTLIALTSDHGESLGEHDELTHGFSLYDATQRVPLLLAGPGLPPGVVVDTPVRLADLAPTLLELVGAPPLEGVEGRSLRPLWEGDGQAEPWPAAYVETLAPQLDLDWSPLLGLRTARWKYLRAPRPELFDLEADPGERESRLEAYPEVAERLEAQLGARLASSRAGALVRMSGEEREALRTLGYLGGMAPAPGRVLGEVGGPDPKDHMQVLRGLAEAETLLTRGEPQAAFERLAGLEARGVGVEALRAAAALAAARPEAAEQAARRALAVEVRRPDLHRLLGRALEEQGRREEARAALRAADALEAGMEAPGGPQGTRFPP